MFSGLTVVIPAYNEEPSIAETVETIMIICPGSRIVVVDDGSKDRTAERAKQAGAGVISHPSNRGYGAALKTGFSSARTDYIAFIDADLTYDPNMIPVLMNAVATEVDCAWGNRFGGETNEMPKIRKLGNRIISIVFFLATFRKVSDCSSGERALKKTVLDKIDFMTLPDDLDFITAFTKRLAARNISFKEFPTNYRTRSGRSKLHIFKHGYRMVKNILMES